MVPSLERYSRVCLHNFGMNLEHWVLERLQERLYRHKQGPRRSHLRISALFVTCMLAIQPSFAQDTSSVNVVESVEAKYAKVNVMQADFTQTIQSQVFGEEVQRGKMTIKRPAKMRWEFSEGARLFVTNGQSMWIYTKQANQVIQYNDVSNTRSTADSLLQSLDDLQSLFTVSVSPGDDKGYVLHLAPKGDAAKFKQVVLTVNSEFVVQKVVITDAVGTVTNLEFKSVALNGSVPDSMFEFEIPKDAEVVNAGGL